jgi:1,4-alpha-glucan branching enzyme
MAKAEEGGVLRDSFQEELESIVRAEHSDPFHFLGPHWIERDGRPALAIRVLWPGAEGVSIIGIANQAIPAARIHPDGLFEALVSPETAPARQGESVSPAAYRLRFRFPGGVAAEWYDPYAFPPLLSEYDLYLSGEGTHYLKYEKLGAHVREVAGVRGVHFGVWAPNAKRVSVVGDFDSWDGRIHAMRSRGASGIWEIFLPGLGEGTLYKFEILSRYGDSLGLKSDPYGFWAEVRPKSASVVFNIDHYEWNDSAWLKARAARDWLHAPMSIYEVHAGSWRRKAGEGNR